MNVHWRENEKIVNDSETLTPPELNKQADRCTNQLKRCRPGYKPKETEKKTKKKKWHDRVCFKTATSERERNGNEKRFSLRSQQVHKAHLTQNIQ